LIRITSLMEVNIVHDFFSLIAPLEKGLRSVTSLVRGYRLACHGGYTGMDQADRKRWRR